MRSADHWGVGDDQEEALEWNSLTENRLPVVADGGEDKSDSP